MSELQIIDEPCQSCNGACCKTVGYPPFLGVRDGIEDAEWRNLPNSLKEQVLDGFEQIRHLIELPCVWLDPNGRCRHYEVRPAVCRNFEANGPVCITLRPDPAELGIKSGG